MNLRSIFTLSFLLTCFPILTNAQENVEAQIREAMCYACHQMQEASIGPSWQAVATRHGDKKELMTEVLANKIVHGGGGNWGLIPMVPNQRVDKEKALLMSQWILEQAN